MSPSGGSLEPTDKVTTDGNGACALACTAGQRDRTVTIEASCRPEGNEWDPCPFILMNLFLPRETAYTAPMLMMSQNRLAARDRLEARNDDEVSRKAEEG